MWWFAASAVRARKTARRTGWTGRPSISGLLRTRYVKAVLSPTFRQYRIVRQDLMPDRARLFDVRRRRRRRWNIFWPVISREHAGRSSALVYPTHDPRLCTRYKVASAVFSDDLSSPNVCRVISSEIVYDVRAKIRITIDSFAVDPTDESRF